MPGRRCRPLTPSLATSSTNVPSSRLTRTVTSVSWACFWAFRTASASTDWASGSAVAGTSSPDPYSASTQPELGMHPSERG